MASSNGSSLKESSSEESSSNCTTALEKEHPPDGQPQSAGTPRSVHVRFEPSEGRRLQRPEPTRCPEDGPLWAERPILMKRADATYELIGTSRNLTGLAKWILSFGPQAEVQCPDQLRRRVAAEARRIWRQYSEL